MTNSIACSGQDILIIGKGCVHIVRINEKEGKETKRSVVKMASQPVLVHSTYVVTEDKSIVRVRVDNNGVERVQKVGTVARKPTKMCRCIEEGQDVLYVSDRLGSVYRIDVQSIDASTDVSSTSTKIFGSISAVTDMCVLERYIVTVDKDRKIRITTRGAPHTIERFVMVHAMPLAAVCVVDSRYIIAGGYDTYLSVYDIESTHTSIYNIDTAENKEYNARDIPGIQDAAHIPNLIQEDAQCTVKKLLYSKGIVVVIQHKGIRVLRVQKENERVVLREVCIQSKHKSINAVDGIEYSNVFVLITEDRDVYTADFVSEEIVRVYSVCAE